MALFLSRSSCDRTTHLFPTSWSRFDEEYSISFCVLRKLWLSIIWHGVGPIGVVSIAVGKKFNLLQLTF